MYKFPDKIFPSRVTPYLKCPLKFKYKNDDEIKVEFVERPATFMGTVIHDTLENIFDITETPIEKRDKVDVREMVRDVWRTVQNKNTRQPLTKEERTELFGSREQERAFGLKSINIIKNFLAGADLSIVPLALEEWVQCDADEFTLAGRVDRVDQESDDEIAIWDYKTGKLPYHKNIKKMMEHDFQIPIYSVIAGKRYPGAKRIRAGLIYVQYSKVYDIVWEREELEELENDLIKQLKDIKNQDKFPPKLNKLCPWCDYKDICPAYEGQ